MHHRADEEDRALLKAFAEGDSDAFVKLVTIHRASVERFVAHAIGRRAEVDDIVQETFLAVVDKPTGFSGQGTVRGWLFGIARHKISRQFRRRVDEPAQFEEVETLGLKAGWGNPEVDATAHQREELLHAALAQLPHQAREVLVLRDIEGLTNVETAKVLELEVNAVKSRLHRARLMLLAELADTEVAHG